MTLYVSGMMRLDHRRWRLGPYWTKDQCFYVNVPSNKKPVKPFGEPHWSSSLGDAPIIDFRVQVATKEDFSTTKAH